MVQKKPKKISMKTEINQILDTIADLSEAVGNGFERVGRELADIKGQLNHIESKIFIDHEARIERLEYKTGITGEEQG
jgi:hypothetical protein